MNRRPSWVPLRELLTPFEAGVSVNANGRPAWANEVGVLKVSCVRGGHFFPDENKAVLPAEISRVAVSPKQGDIVISRANTPDLIGACGLVRTTAPTSICRTSFGAPAHVTPTWTTLATSWGCSARMSSGRPSGFARPELAPG